MYRYTKIKYMTSKAIFECKIVETVGPRVLPGLLRQQLTAFGRIILRAYIGCISLYT